MLAAIVGGVAGGYDLHASGLGQNGWGAGYQGGYNLMSAILFEFVATLIFVFVILGSTHGRAPAGFAPIAIGLCLTLIHLISIPVTNTSVNPARSTAPALFAGGWAIDQLWLFWLAPIAGALLAGFVYRWLSPDVPSPAEVSGQR